MTPINTDSTPVGASPRVRPFYRPFVDWDLIFFRLTEDYIVHLLVDNIPVTITLVASFADFKLLIRPRVNGHYVPDFVKPIFEYEKYPPGMNEILDRFYQKRTYITKLGKKNKKRNCESYYDEIYYYTDFPNFKTFKKHYQENFDEIIILDSPVEPAPDSLPADLSQALPQPQTKALNPGDDKQEVHR